MFDPERFTHSRLCAPAIMNLIELTIKINCRQYRLRRVENDIVFCQSVVSLLAYLPAHSIWHMQSYENRVTDAFM